MISEQILRQIHDSGKRFVLAITGGGATAVGALLAVPGGSRSLLECTVPYSEAALRQWLGGTPEQWCSEPTARAMAMAAFMRARRLDAECAGGDPYHVVGVGCTASLVSDRPKRGTHRVHVCWQSAEQSVAYSLELIKGARTRGEEEKVCAVLVLAAIAESAGAESA